MASKTNFSTKEAAVLAGISEKVVRHEMAQEIAVPTRRFVGKAARWTMDAHDVFYLNLLALLPVTLKPEDRRDLYVLIRHRLRSNGRWAAADNRLCLRGAVDVEFDTTIARRELAQRIRIFRRGRRRVVSDPDIGGGEPIFAGTRIAIRHIGLLAQKGVPLAEILEDHPALTEEDVAFACLYVDLRPDPGRPRKALAFKRSA